MMQRTSPPLATELVQPFSVVRATTGFADATGDPLTYAQLQGAVGASGSIISHIADHNNPHAVTAAQLSISPSGEFAGTNVQDSVLNLEHVLAAHKANTSNPHITTAAQVGAIATSARGAANGVAGLDSGGKLDAAVLPSINLDFQFTAGETLATRDLVFIELSSGVGTAGRAYKCDADAIAKSTEAYIAGFVVAGVNAGEAVTVRMAGLVTGFSGLTVGAPQYAGTSGAITSTAPVNDLLVGIAVSSSALFINSRGTNSTVTPTPPPTQYGYNWVYNGGASACDKTDLSADTTSVVAGGAIASGQNGWDLAINGGSTKGYRWGDSGNGQAYKLPYSTETIARVSGADMIDGTGTAKAGWSNGSSLGYSFHDADNNQAKLAFSTDTTSAISSTPGLGTNMGNQSNGHCNGAKGYLHYSGGDKGSIFTFSTESWALWGAAVSGWYPASDLSGTSVAGYQVVGTAGMKKTTYSTDGQSSVSGGELSSNRQQCGVPNDGTIKGFFVGGNTGSDVTTAEKFTYGTETLSAASGANSTIGGQKRGCANTGAF